MHYLREPVFWLSVVVVAFVINFVWNYFTKKGQLV